MGTKCVPNSRSSPVGPESCDTAGLISSSFLFHGTAAFARPTANPESITYLRVYTITCTCDGLMER